MRAKQNYRNKEKNTPSFSKSGKSFEDEEEEFIQEGKITTFKVLKRGSLNTPLVKVGLIFDYDVK